MRNQLNPHRLALVVVVGMVGLALAACGSSGGKAASPPQKRAPASTAPSTTSTTNPSGLANQADALCSELGTASKDLSRLNLSAPGSAGTVATTVGTDLEKLQTTLKQVSDAGQSGARHGPLQTMVSDAKGALSNSESALAQITQGNLGNAKASFNSAVGQLKAARTAGGKANLSSCTASAS